MKNDPREFSCFNDFDNDGWNNSTTEREENIEEEDLEDDIEGEQDE